MTKIRIAIVLIVLFVTGIVLTVSGLSDIIKLSGNVPDFNYESMQNLKSGSFVQGYVWNIDGCYGYVNTTNSTMGIETSSYTSEEYFAMPLVNETDLAEGLYITVSAKKKADRDLLYDICDATWEYYEGNEDAYFPEMGIVAKVKKLDPEWEDYLVEWFQLEPAYFESEADARAHIVPYELQIYNPSSAYTSLGIGLVIILAFVVVGIIIYSKYKASLTPYSAQSAAPAADDFAIERKPSENGFEEAYTPPQPVPIPDIPQPVQPDEFFAKAPKAAPVAEEPQEELAAPPVEEPKQEAAAPITGGVLGSMDELDTTGMFDDADYEVDTNSDENDFIE